MPRDRYLKTSEVALILHVSPKTISRWAKEGRLPYMATLGGHRRFPANEINQLTDDLARMSELMRSPARQ
ncbi:MAG: helix-turn-helix domain-containing protein [Actinomycetota bacterium]